MPELKIGRGRTVLLDDADFKVVQAHHWYASNLGRTGRPVRSVANDKGGYSEVAMIRLLVPALGRGQQVKYRNGDAFDLRRENLILPAAIQAAPSPLARGAVAELMVAADLFRHGLEVFTPLHGYSRWDMLAVDKAGQIRRVQVKSAHSKNGVMVAGLRSVTTNSKGHQTRPLSVNDLELVAIFDSASRKIAYLAPDELNPRSSISICVTDRTTVGARANHGARTRIKRFADELTDPWRALSRNSPEAPKS